MAEAVGNTRDIPIVLERQYDLLEQLPVELRNFLVNARYNYAVSHVLDAWKKLKSAGMAHDEALALLLRNGGKVFELEARIRARVAYGPEHPEALGVSDEELKLHGVFDLARENDDWRYEWTTRKNRR